MKSSKLIDYPTNTCPGWPRYYGISHTRTQVLLCKCREQQCVTLGVLCAWIQNNSVATVGENMCSTSRIAVIGHFRVSDPFKIGAPTSLSLLKANWIGVDTTKPTNYIYLYTINNKI
jgi:hypothetical protein